MLVHLISMSFGFSSIFSLPLKCLIRFYHFRLYHFLLFLFTAPSGCEILISVLCIANEGIPIFQLRNWVHQDKNIRVEISGLYEFLWESPSTIVINISMLFVDCICENKMMQHTNVNNHSGSGCVDTTISVMCIGLSETRMLTMA